MTVAMMPEDTILSYAERAWADRSRTLGVELGDVSGQTVLDLCAGPGTYTQALLARKAARVVWYDVSPTFRAIAQARLGARPDVEYRLRDLAALDAEPAGEFDGVFFRGGLHHALHEGAVLCAIARVLKPGGWLYLNYPTYRRLSVRKGGLAVLHHVPLVLCAGILDRKPKATLFCSRRMVARGLSRAGFTLRTRAALDADEVLLAVKARG